MINKKQNTRKGCFNFWRAFIDLFRTNHMDKLREIQEFEYDIPWINKALTAEYTALSS